MRDDAGQYAPLFRFDPGWLFLLAGGALLSCVALIPAQDDLLDAAAHRDRALALETHRSARLAKYSGFLDALGHRDTTLMIALAETQLNQAPADMQPLINSTEVVQRSAEVFSDLEPKLVPPAIPPRPDSLLHKLATNDSSRLWVMVIAAVAILYGLLPDADKRQGSVAGQRTNPGRRDLVNRSGVPESAPAASLAHGS